MHAQRHGFAREPRMAPQLHVSQDCYEVVDKAVSRKTTESMKR
jgi:hypothetical protein